MKLRVAMLIASPLLSLGCQSSAKLPMTQLQVRQMQTRHYEIDNPRRAVKAILNVLQDQGFIPKEVSADVGYVFATREIDLEDPGERFWAKFWHGKRDAKWNKNSIVECAANVTERHRGVRVRLTFQVKVFDNNGRVVSIKTVDDPLFYQTFFISVGKSIFLEREKV